jgi:hypothetical protein
MNAEQQRIAIAEACGFSDTFEQWPSSVIGKTRLVGYYKNGELVEVPNYLNDLNAMHEAEKVLNGKQQVWYLQKLTQVRFKQGVSGMVGCMIDKTTFATAAQRAEAFLRTLGLWKDSKNED